MNTTTAPINPSPSTLRTSEEEKFERAYERLSAERDALSEERIDRVNVDIANSVNMVLAQLPQIRALRARIEALPEFDISALDKLESYAQALAYAHMLHNAASKPIEPVPGLAEELIAARDRLSTDAKALVRRGLLDGSRLRDLKGGTGFKNVAYDVGTLVALMRSAWPRIAGKTAVTEAELRDAQVSVEKLLLAVAARETRHAAAAAAMAQRQRAFTLLASAYDQVRRAVTYLCWGEDGEKVAPSFYNGRGKKRRVDPPETHVNAPSPARSVNPSPARSVNPSPARSDAGSGMPGTSPYGGH